MSFSYNPILVVLSVLVAMQAGYVGLTLAQRIPLAFAMNRRLLIAASAMTLSVGIWSMHFIGMLAIITVATIDYLVLPTLLSFLVCVLVTGIAIYMASLRERRWLILGALFMGLGIASMHYLGMMALHSSAIMTHKSIYVFASVIIAVAASGLALWLAFLAGSRFPILIDAIIFGVAVSGMHYVAMAGTTLSFVAEPLPSSSFISSDVLAVIVSIVAFSISGIFMLTLIPKGLHAAQEDGAWMPTQTENVQDIPTGNMDTRIPTNEAKTATLPIEKNGNAFQIAASEIVSVHANAHYTFIFNGRDDLFCPLSISDVDERLNSAKFFRTHRSYIVNLDHIVRLRKSGDAALAELDCAIRRTVPVSRARVGPLRNELAAIKPKNNVSE